MRDHWSLNSFRFGLFYAYSSDNIYGWLLHSFLSKYLAATKSTTHRCTQMQYSYYLPQTYRSTQRANWSRPQQIGVKTASLPSIWPYYSCPSLASKRPNIMNNSNSTSLWNLLTRNNMLWIHLHIISSNRLYPLGQGSKNLTERTIVGFRRPSSNPHDFSIEQKSKWLDTSLRTVAAALSIHDGAFQIPPLANLLGHVDGGRDDDDVAYKPGTEKDSEEN